MHIWLASVGRTALLPIACAARAARRALRLALHPNIGAQLHSLFMNKPLLLLGGANDPVKYVIDCATFPFRLAESAGRETRITMVAAGLGLALWLTGLLGRWFV